MSNKHHVAFVDLKDFVDVDDDNIDADVDDDDDLVAAVDLETIEGLEELHESFQPVRDYDNDDGMIGYYVVIKSKKVSGGTP